MLSDLGFTQGSRIAVISRNSVEWFAFAMAAYGLRAHLVALPEEMATHDLLAALEDAQPAVVWCGGKDMYEQVSKAISARAFASGPGGLLPKQDQIFCIDGVDGFVRFQDYALTHRLGQFRDKKVHRQFVPHVHVSLSLSLSLSLSALYNIT